MLKKAAGIVGLGLGLVLATLAAVVARPVPVDEKLISIQAQEMLPDFEPIREEPVEVHAAIVDLGEDPLLLLKAQIALLTYPEMARTIFPLYASEPEFRDVLRVYGEHALPPIEYFLREPIRSVEWMHMAEQQVQRAQRFWAELRGQGSENQMEPDDTRTLTAEQRGWYAVNFIEAEGHDFVGQFVIDEKGRAQWVQTERVLEGIGQFFAGGIRELESSYRSGEDITAGDIGWASVDVLVFASAVKVLRAGRAVTAGTRGAGLSTRTAALAARVTATGRMVLNSARYAKWPIVIGASYLVIRHPDIISDLLAGVADVLGVPRYVVQIAGWFVILVPLLYLLSWLLLPVIFVLKVVLGMLQRLAGSTRHGPDLQ